MVVIVRRLVRCCREVVRSIALVVHHIQATHSDGPERLIRRRKSEERNAHKTAEGRLSTETSDVLYPPGHRCLHICPNAYNGHVVQFAYRQCASRCALHQHHPGPQNGSKRYETNTLYPKKEEEEKKNSSLTSFQTASDWVSIPFPPSPSFCFGGELYLERAGAVYSRPPGKGAVEFSKALTPQLRCLRFFSHRWHSFIKSCMLLWVMLRSISLSPEAPDLRTCVSELRTMI